MCIGGKKCVFYLGILLGVVVCMYPSGQIAVVGVLYFHINLCQVVYSIILNKVLKSPTVIINLVILSSVLSVFPSYILKF